MTSKPGCFVLDANVFIEAKNRFYAFDFCPGFWDALIWHHGQGSICSIDRVHEELERGGDDLTNWVSQVFGKQPFHGTTSGAVVEAYSQLNVWVATRIQFSDGAKHEFQSAADGWLMAYAMFTKKTVVTSEQYSPDAKRKVPIPNVCRAFGIQYINPFEMLRRLDVKLCWQAGDRR